MSKTEKYPDEFKYLNLSKIAEDIPKSKNYFSTFLPNRNPDTIKKVADMAKHTRKVIEIAKTFGEKS